MKPIFIIGYMASGKTTLGRALARELSLEFIDLDFYISQRFRMSIEEIFAKKGEEEFRRMESEMLREVGGMENVIISCGGGTPCFNNNMDYILQSGFSVWLDATTDCIIRRLQVAKVKRPLVIGKTEEELHQTISDHLEQRLPHYTRANLHISGNKLENRKEIASTIANLLPLLPI